MKNKKNQTVIIRTYSAGVHYGTLVRREGKEVELADNRRVWAWQGAFTLNELATTGPGKGSRISVAGAGVVLTEAIEILTCTDAAIDAFKVL